MAYPTNINERSDNFFDIDTKDGKLDLVNCINIELKKIIFSKTDTYSNYFDITSDNIRAKLKKDVNDIFFKCRLSKVGYYLYFDLFYKYEQTIFNKSVYEFVRNEWHGKKIYSSQLFNNYSEYHAELDKIIFVDIFNVVNNSSLILKYKIL